MRGSRIVVNLAALRRGGGVTHVSGFVPELVARRPDDRFVAIVPVATAELVESWGVHVIPHDVPAGSPRMRLWLDQVLVRRRGRRSELVLSPLNHGPVVTAAPQIVWACNALYFDSRRSALQKVDGAFARAAMRLADLVIYPSASMRSLAEHAGVTSPGLVLRHPLRVPEDAAPVPSSSRDTMALRILVPSSNQWHKNLHLLPRLSAVLTGRGVRHEIRVTASLPPRLATGSVTGGFRYDRDAVASLVDAFDVVLIPSVAESYSYPLVEFEQLGLPVVATDIPVHRELRHRARLFHPASPHGAADALQAAVHEPLPPPGEPADWRFSTPAAYAAAVSAEMDRLLLRGVS